MDVLLVLLCRLTGGGLVCPEAFLTPLGADFISPPPLRVSRVCAGGRASAPARLAGPGWRVGEVFEQIRDEPPGNFPAEVTQRQQFAPGDHVSARCARAPPRFPGSAAAG